MQRVNILCKTYFFNSVFYDTSSKIEAIASTEFAADECMINESVASSTNFCPAITFNEPPIGIGASLTI